MTELANVWGYSLTWLEAFAFVFTLANVVLNVRANVLAWPLGIVGTALYAVLFFGAKLYGDFSLQFVFIGSSIYGWYEWARGGEGATSLPVTGLSHHSFAVHGLVALSLWPLLGAFFDRFTDTDVPYYDAFPTALSLVGQWLLARKVLENWYFWIVADVVYVALYASKSLMLTSLLYAIFLVLCVFGLREWKRGQKRGHAPGA